MTTAKVKAYGKINLTLDITGTCEGYHTLDSFVATVDLYDLVVAKKRKDKRVCVEMKGLDAEKIPPFDNNAQKAAERFVERFDTCGADITVFRNIPSGAGLGGSSADIAGVLNAMEKLYPIENKREIKAVADGLGSDSGYLLTGGFARISGRGTIVENLPAGEKKLYLLLICPKTGVGAGECYRKYDEMRLVGGRATAACVDAFLKGELEEVGKALSNDLYLPAASVNQDVALALEEAKSFSPLGASMTGSGSAVFALFDSRELRDWAKSRYRGRFRTIAAETVDPREQKKGFRFPFALTKDERD